MAGSRPLSLWLLFFLLLPTLACTQDQYAPVSPITGGVVHPDWAVNGNLYEVNIRQYTTQGTFRAFDAELPRLGQMGVRILWLMPIHPIGELNRKGTLGSYYSVKDYLAVNPEFGTMEDFQQLVRDIHAQDMYVILDWVANHTAWDNALVNDHPDWYMNDDSGRFVSPNPDWHDVVDLNYEVPELRAYMIEAMKFWLTEGDVDGFRCD